MNTTLPLHILLADDDHDDHAIFQEALHEIGINVLLTRVNDGKELMLWLMKHKNNLPDLLFLDLRMPGKNGHDCLEEIRQDPDLQSLPVIIYSSSIDFDRLEKLHTNGAQYYIKKPAVFGVIVETLKMVLHLPKENKRIQPPLHEFIIPKPE